MPRELRAPARGAGGRRASSSRSVVLALALVPVVFTESRTNLAAVAVIYGVIALSLVVLTGLGGRDQPRADGVRRDRRRRRAASITARLGWDLAFGLLGGGTRRRGGRRAHRPAGAATARAHHRGDHAGVLARHDRVAAQPAVSSARARASTGCRRRGSSGPTCSGSSTCARETALLPPLPRGARAGRRGRRRHPPQSHRPGAGRDPRERTGRQRVRREPAAHHARRVRRSRGSSPRSRARCSCTTRTACNSTPTPRARASWCSRWS